VEEAAPAPGRWRELGLWWGLHALVGGAARVVFEASLPVVTTSTRFAFSSGDVARTLQLGTFATVAAKLCCGPIIAALSRRALACLSLLLVAASVLGFGLSNGADTAPLLPFAIAWISQKTFQCATFPGFNKLLVAWFPKAEHGRAWAIMSTASRAGILVVTLSFSYLDSRQTGEHDASNSITIRFRVVAAALLTYLAVIATFLREVPPRPQSTGAALLGHNPSASAADAGGPVAGKKVTGERHERPRAPSGSPTSAPDAGSFVSQLARTMVEPVFVCALLVQASVTPIAEFQSQLPLLLAREEALSSAEGSWGLSLWHLGIHSLMTFIRCARRQSLRTLTPGSLVTNQARYARSSAQVPKRAPGTTIPDLSIHPSIFVYIYILFIGIRTLYMYTYVSNYTPVVLQGILPSGNLALHY